MPKLPKPQNKQRQAETEETLISYDTSEDTCSRCSLLRNSNLNRLENYVKDALQWFTAPKYTNSSVEAPTEEKGTKGPE